MHTHTQSSLRSGLANLIDKSLNFKVGNKAGKGSCNLQDDNVVRKEYQKVRGMKVPILIYGVGNCWLKCSLLWWPAWRY